MASTMERNRLLSVLVLLLLPLFAACAERQAYIVYFGEHSGEKTHQEIEDTHHSYLSTVKESEEDAKASLLYSYKHSINGFAAVLTKDEASRLSELKEVVSVIPSYPRKYSLHTTRTWQFAGVETTNLLNPVREKEMLLKAEFGKDVIVGLLDTGVWPESKSFSDEGMGPVPKSWKGECVSADSFNSTNCNKKLIGGRYYLKGYESYYGHLNASTDYRSPRDRNGHGTHTSSTVAGRRVKNVSVLGGFARGTATGGAPLARVAMYKVCWAMPKGGDTCFDEDMLAAFDDAIHDGVDVLSVSIGGHDPTPYNNDSISIGALHALKNNIVVSCSAGNDGPAAATLTNPAPWIITVAASSVDRSFVGPLFLGNGRKIMGQTVTTHKLEEKKMYPLVYAAQVVGPGVNKDDYIAGQCLPGSLSPEKTKGKIVFCLRGNGTRIGKGEEVKRAGGAGYVLGNSPANGAELVADAHVLPATGVNAADAVKILKYINTTTNPTAYIGEATTVLETKPNPFMAAFSSRGPNVLTPDILKPDVTAPGLNILAAWTEATSRPGKDDGDSPIIQYNVISGTSMSCPHVAATAALLKAIHPTWSSAAIRSAIITTAGTENNIGMTITESNGKTADPFQFGAGHFRPRKAADPGLVYDASYEDYLLFLCSSGITDFDRSFKCPEVSPPVYDLNYPSLSISKLNGTVTVKRTVTNVGGTGKSVYFSCVKPPVGVAVEVSPSVLYFGHIGQKRSFTITVKPESYAARTIRKNETGFGWFAWNDGIHTVRSPMAVSLA
ncbi:subtilisin-like protease SBT5.6 [Diospyros lotus]|uniref:subtilisin-like protease SBT5.6 n=1 Tax=Diospyros lotus TaxID=55363 RepID=UPI0022579BD9|nr:subtilisin-like protease SBT5.6 [Diospyros lotus]